MNKRSTLAMAAGAVIFLGSALLFNVQPMSGRMLLPRFGGSAAVWTACLVAFQLLLLAGYGYAAWVSRLRPARQVLIHILLLAAAAAWPGMTLLARVPAADHLPPALRVLLLVIAGTGPAYLLLSAGSTLVQSWLARVQPDWNVYPLYAISNVGSLVGLFAYPFLVEPHLSLSAQQTLWRVLFGGYGLVLAGLAVVLIRSRTDSSGTRVRRPVPLPEQDGAGTFQADSSGTRVRRPVPLPEQDMAGTFQADSSGTRVRIPVPLQAQDVALQAQDVALQAQDVARVSRPVSLWWLLPLLNSFLLTATTASLTADITPMPMVWCLLLGAFLLGYVGGFTTMGETQTPLWAVLTVCFMTGFGLCRGLGWGSISLALFLGTGVVLFGGLFLSGRLYAARPPSDRLPVYYLAIAAGGAAGGLLAGIAAPLLLKGVYEYGLIAAILALLAAFFMFQRRRQLDPLEVWLTALAALAVIVIEPLIVGSQLTQSMWRNRNFYGVMRVTDSEIGSKYGDVLGRMHSLVHGSTVHGFQALTATLRDTPTQYYGSFGGGYPIRRHIALHPDQPLRVGVIGLGTGTLAAYGRTGDDYRFYEINPQVEEAARNTNLFTFLSDSPARIEVALGDARLTLERETAAGEAPWDVLIVDAFSGDSVPLHLLTREAIRLYLARTGQEGVVAFHISNRFIDLLPLLKAAAKDQGVRFFAWHNRVGKTPMESESRWVLMTRAADSFRGGGHMIRIREEDIPAFPVMTDECGSVLALIDWGQTRMERYVMKKGD